MGDADPLDDSRSSNSSSHCVANGSAHHVGICNDTPCLRLVLAHGFKCGMHSKCSKSGLDDKRGTYIGRHRRQCSTFHLHAVENILGASDC